MIKVKARNGFEIEVRENIGNDWRVVKALSNLKRADDDLDKIGAYADLIIELIGSSEEARLCEYLENKFGYVPTDEVEAVATDIFEALREAVETKN